MSVSSLVPIVDHVLDGRLPPPPRRAEVVRAVARRVAAHLEVQPAMLRVGVFAALAAVDAGAVASAGRPLRLLEPARAGRALQWEVGVPGVPALLDLIRSLALLYLYEHPEVTAALGCSPPEGGGGGDELDPSAFSLPPAGRRLACEVLIVGSGAGGSIVACDLTEAGVDVVLLEEGEYSPLDVPRPYTTAEMVAKYRHGGVTPALGRPPVAYVEARCVGGGTEVNSGLYHRPPPDALARWRDRWAVRDLTEESLAPFIERCERDLSVGPARRPAPLGSRLLSLGAERLGWRAHEVPRWWHYGPHGEGQGRRASMSRTLLPRALRAGLRMIPGCRVDRLTWRGDRATGAIATTDDGRTLSVDARAVVVCAGAIHTPALMRRSGLKRNLGDTLAVHPTAKAVGVFDQDVDAFRAGVPVHQVREFAPALSLGGSVSTPGHVALALANNGADALGAMREWRRCAVYYAAARGEPRGTVRQLPGRTGVLVRYDVTDEALGQLSLGIGRLSRVLLAAGAREVWPSLRGHPPIRSDADARRYEGGVLRRDEASLMTVHLFSSAPLGEDRRRCACDSWGKVHGVEGLWVADASLLPDAPGCNPQGTIMALARRVASRLLEDAPWRR